MSSVQFTIKASELGFHPFAITIVTDNVSSMTILGYFNDTTYHAAAHNTSVVDSERFQMGTLGTFYFNCPKDLSTEKTILLGLYAKLGDREFEFPPMVGSVTLVIQIREALADYINSDAFKKKNESS